MTERWTDEDRAALLNVTRDPDVWAVVEAIAARAYAEGRADAIRSGRATIEQAMRLGREAGLREAEKAILAQADGLADEMGAGDMAAQIVADLRRDEEES